MNDGMEVPQLSLEKFHEIAVSYARKKFKEEGIEAVTSQAATLRDDFGIPIEEAKIFVRGMWTEFPNAFKKTLSP